MNTISAKPNDFNDLMGWPWRCVSVPGETLLTFLGVVRLVGSRAWVGESTCNKVKKVSPGTDMIDYRRPRGSGKNGGRREVLSSWS